MFRDLFERETNAIWAQLRRLAKQDARLERLYGADADGRVARLVQSGAFAFASVRANLENDDQALTRPLVAAALPECLRPRPASTILQRSLREADARDVRGYVVSARVGEVTVPFEIMWPVRLAPIELIEARLDRIHAQRQVLRFAWGGVAGVALGNVLPETIRLFLHLEPRRVALDLLHSLRTAAEPIQAIGYSPDGRRIFESALPPSALRWVRVDTDEPPLTSAPVDRFASGTLLRDLFSCPESFSFLDIEVAALRRPGVARIELTLPLARVVEGASSIGREDVRLFCTPATNHYVAPIEPIRAEAAESQWALSVAGRPHAEILHVLSMFVERRADAGIDSRRDIVSWEAPARPHTFEPGDTYFRLEQALSTREPRTEMRISFATLERFFSPAPGPLVEGEVLASDGALAASLGIGDVHSQSHGLTNITRVSPSHRAPLGQNHATRVSAYARMPAARLADPVHLAEFLALHDFSGPHDGQSRVQRPRFVHTRRRREHTLTDCSLQWGDAFEVDVAHGSWSDGELWLMGALLSRAVAERNEAVDFSRLALLRGEGRQRRIFADYGMRAGERLPGPLG